MDRPACVDFERFKTETGLEDYDVKELYKGFLEELLEEREKLKAQFANGDLEKMSRTVHNIKGISSSYMADEVFLRARELGGVLSGNDIHAAAPAMDSLLEAIIEAAGDIFKYIRA